MTEELTAGGPSGRGLLSRAFSKLVIKAGRRVLRWEPEGSVVIELPDGRRAHFGDGVEHGAVFLRLRNYSVMVNALRRGSIGFAQAYLDGDIECSDLAGLFRFYLRNRERFERVGKNAFRVRIADRITHLLRRNTRRGSRRNIAEHYDLGNAFYGLWLDQDMVYSSGLYAQGTESLEQAQRAKLDLVLELLNLSEGEHLLEIGSGWGAFARHAALAQDCRVTGITLSKEQLAHSCERAEETGLSERCAFRLQDYRDVEERYDRIASIEMIEAVGEQNWPLYFNTIHDRLKPGGIAIIQSITIDEARFSSYRRKVDFIQRYIFPGGMLPTPAIIEREASRAGLRLSRVERFGDSYAKTLGAWRTRFEEAWPRIASLGFDEQFRRKWFYYLAYCEVAFEEKVIDVGVYQLCKPGNGASAS